VLQCVAVCCSVLQCDAVCSSVLQCVAVGCSVLHVTNSQLTNDYLYTQIFIGYSLQKSPMISGSFVGKNLQPEAFYACLPPCTD